MSTTAAYVGCSVSNIGDINGDGVDDMIIGSYFQGSYILYGSANPEKNYDLSALDTAHGFQITFSKQGSMSGISVAGNFDLNKDGFNDIAIGTPYGIDGNLVYIFFGSNQKARDNIELTMLTNRQGMCIRTENDNDGTGRLLRAVGDFDHDGYNDLLIGSVFALDSSELLIGSAYVLTDMYSMSTYSPSSAPNIVLLDRHAFLHLFQLSNPPKQHLHSIQVHPLLEYQPLYLLNHQWYLQIQVQWK
jgi:hypothetical protein